MPSEADGTTSNQHGERSRRWHCGAVVTARLDGMELTSPGAIGEDPGPSWPSPVAGGTSDPTRAGCPRPRAKGSGVETPPSGEQFEIRYGDQRATIVEVGGGVREYIDGDRPVLDPYAVEAMCDGEHGAPLIPWPNRLADGLYRFDDTDYAVALNEPERNNAIHGFLTWRPWQALEHHADRVVMTTRIHPLAGFPFTLEIRISYELGTGWSGGVHNGDQRGESALSVWDRPAPLPVTRKRPAWRQHPPPRRFDPHPHGQCASPPNRHGVRRRHRL